MKSTLFYTALFCQIIFCNFLTAQTTTTTTTTTTGDNRSDSRDNDDGAPVIFVGARYMPTFTSFQIKSLGNQTAQTSFALGYGSGAYIGTNFSLHTGAQLEVFYSQLSQNYVVNDRKNRIDLNYLYVPLLFNLNSNISKTVNINIAVGPQVGINMGSRITAQGGANNTDSVTAVIAVKPADLGFAYGAGLDIRILPILTIDFGFRGMVGLIDISDKSKSTTTSEYYILDRSFVKTYAAYVGARLNF